MKKIIFLITLLLLVGTVNALTSDDVTLWYDFDTGSGSTVYDKSPNGNDLTLFNSPTWGNCTLGTIDTGCLTFNGINQYGTIPDNYKLRLNGSFTIVAWLTTPYNTSRQAIIFKGDTAPARDWFSFGYGSPTSPQTIEHNIDDGVVTTFARGGSFPRINRNEDTFIVGYRNYSNFLGIRKNDDNRIQMVDNSGDIASTSGNIFEFGKGAITTNYLNATLYTFAIFNKSLSESEMDFIYNNGNATDYDCVINGNCEVFFGVDYNKTYYKENFLYYYNFSVEENNGIINKDYTTTYNTNDCVSDTCFNTSKGTFTDSTETKFYELDNYSISFWLKTNVTSGTPISPVNIFRATNDYRSGDAVIEEKFILALDENGEFVIFTQLNSGSYNLDTGITPNNTQNVYITFTWTGNNIQIWKNTYIVYNQSIFSPKLIHNFQTLQSTDSGTTVYIGEANEMIIDDFTFSTFAYDKEDIEQLIYYSEQNNHPTLENYPFPQGAVLQQPNGTIITLTPNNYTQEFSWNNSYDKFNNTVYYSLYSATKNIVLNTTNNATNYTFVYGQWANGTYDTIIQSCNFINCGNTTFTDSFSICINNWEQITQPCVSNTRLTLYKDANNCPVSYGLPVTNGTYEECIDPEIEAQLTQNENNIMMIVIIAIILFIMFIQLTNNNFMLTATLGIINILLIISLAFIGEGYVQPAIYIFLALAEVVIIFFRVVKQE